MAELRLDGSELRSFAKSLVVEVVNQLDELRQVHKDRLAYTEAEAAAMLGLKQHQLRDIRLAKRIGHTRIVGRQIRYTLPDLLTYLARGHEDAKD